MIKLYNNLGVGLCPYIQLKLMPFPVIPAVMAAVQVGSTVYNALSRSKQNRDNLQNQNDLYSKQREQQDTLNANGALIKRQSLQRAGLNPMADFGYSPNLQASVPAQATQEAPQLDTTQLSNGVNNILSLLQNKPLVEANTRKVNADAEKQEIENDIKKAEVNANPNGVIDIGERNYQLSLANFSATITKLNADSAEDNLRAMVANGQLQNPKVAQALIKMPYREYRYLYNQCQELAARTAEENSNHEYIDSKKLSEDLEREITQNSNLMELIDKYIPEGGLRDLSHLLVILFSGVTGTKVNLGHNKTVVNREGNSSTHTHTHNTTINNKNRSYHQGDKLNYRK